MATRGVSADEMTNEFATAKVRYRGVEYVMRELSMDEYDKTVKLATAKVVTPENPEGDETFDGTAHTKILTIKSVVSPKMSADQLYSKGTRLVRALQVQVAKLHWDPEPEEKGEDDDEGEAPAPAKE